MKRENGRYAGVIGGPPSRKVVQRRSVSTRRRRNAPSRKQGMARSDCMGPSCRVNVAGANPVFFSGSPMGLKPVSEVCPKSRILPRSIRLFGHTSETGLRWNQLTASSASRVPFGAWPNCWRTNRAYSPLRASSSSWAPASTIRPSSMARIRSALRTVLRR